MVPPIKVLQAGVDYWFDYLIGIFFDSTAANNVVKFGNPDVAVE